MKLREQAQINLMESLKKLDSLIRKESQSGSSFSEIEKIKNIVKNNDERGLKNLNKYLISLSRRIYETGVASQEVNGYINDINFILDKEDSIS
ncbi:hypothetical protein [Leptospira koniambonensis]|uniref:hypothetical protein n=1 Tax=Leptospira koniambonensis TaxID=2484950 RepID=UPI003EC0CD47